MGEFKYIPPRDSAERHRAVPNGTQNRGKAAPTQATPRAPVLGVQKRQEYRNVEPVLSLGGSRYFAIHSMGLRLCIPPVPFKLGQRVLDVYTKTLNHASAVARDGSKSKDSDAYFDGLGTLAKLLWKHVRPTGKVKRVLWRCGLLRNPLRRISEGELANVTDFFLQGRMKSTVQSLSEQEAFGLPS